MSTTPGSGASLGTTRARDTHDERLGTETKSAPKTTEFMLTLAVIAGILLSALLIKGGDSGDNATDEFIARHAWLYVSIVTAGYAIGRGLAKSGSREPYWVGGDNENRNRDSR